jgi:PAS domain S-box-containing protein
MKAAELLNRRNLEHRLAEAEATIEALLTGQIDAVVDAKSRTPVLLSRAQEALRESEERYRRIVETANEGIGVLDAQLELTFVNGRLAQLLGYPVHELLGKSLSQFMPKASGARAALQAGHSRQGVSEEQELGFLRRDGSDLWALLKTSPTRDADGNCVGTLAMITDRTEHKLVEQAKLALEQQLRQSQKMEAVGRLAGGIAHDFNNLLSVILTGAELILEDLKAVDPLREEVEGIHSAGLRAADLTRQLLMFSRQQVVAPKVLDLNELLLGMDRMLRRLVGEDVELTSIPGVALGRVRADPGSLEQVIVNLVVNARDAMPAGGKLTMETVNVVLDQEYADGHLGAKTGAYVMLSVTDSGTGIDKATLAQIFEPFFTTKPQGKGTGLGLSTAFGIVQQSGGNIWVYSELGLGTTFKIYLPRVDAPAEALRPSRRPTGRHGSETVLLVEDEKQVRHMASTILRRHGYTVIEAGSGTEALQRCEQHDGSIQLLLSDVVMPGMSGPELALRLAPLRPEMMFLCMSGYTDDAAVRHGVLDATFAYLQKPFTVETLTRKVRDVLDSKHSVRPTVGGGP